MNVARFVDKFLRESVPAQASVVTQSTKPLADGGETYPATGEIDLMKYYNGNQPYNFYTRVVVSELDATSLV